MLVLPETAGAKGRGGAAALLALLAILGLAVFGWPATRAPLELADLPAVELPR